MAENLGAQLLTGSLGVGNINGDLILKMFLFGIVAIAVGFFIGYFVKKSKYKILVLIKLQNGKNITWLKPDIGRAQGNFIHLFYKKLYMPLFDNRFFFSDKKGRSVIAVLWDGNKKFVPIPPEHALFEHDLSLKYEDIEFLEEQAVKAPERHKKESWLMKNIDKIAIFASIVVMLIMMLIFVNQMYKLTELSANTATAMSKDTSKSLDQASGLLKEISKLYEALGIKKNLINDTTIISSVGGGG
jgi:hypothetical protein